MTKPSARGTVAASRKVPDQASPSKTVAPAKPAPTKTAAAKTPAKAAATPPAAARPTAAARPAAPARPAKAAKPPVAVVEPAPVAPSAAAQRFLERFAPARPVAAQPIEPLRAPAKVDPKLAGAWKTKAAAELTEAEVLAMPDSEYMNDKQREFFRLRLLAQKNDLLSNADETTEHLREVTSIVPDPADRATIEEEHALELRTRDRERKLLKKIGQSLARVESGDYGYCAETGEPIGLARLLARPTATLSLEAQQRREMKQKMFGD